MAARTGWVAAGGRPRRAGRGGRLPPGRLGSRWAEAGIVLYLRRSLQRLQDGSSDLEVTLAGKLFGQGIDSTLARAWAARQARKRLDRPQPCRPVRGGKFGHQAGDLRFAGGRRIAADHQLARGAVHEALRRGWRSLAPRALHHVAEQPTHGDVRLVRRGGAGAKPVDQPGRETRQVPVRRFALRHGRAIPRELLAVRGGEHVTAFGAANERIIGDGRDRAALGPLGEGATVAAVEQQYLLLGPAVVHLFANFAGGQAARPRVIKVGSGRGEEQPVAAAQDAVAGVVEQHKVLGITRPEQYADAVADALAFLVHADFDAVEAAASRIAQDRAQRLHVVGRRVQRGKPGVVKAADPDQQGVPRHRRSTRRGDGTDLGDKVRHLGRRDPAWVER